MQKHVTKVVYKDGTTIEVALGKDYKCDTWVEHEKLVARTLQEKGFGYGKVSTLTLYTQGDTNGDSN